MSPARLIVALLCALVVEFCLSLLIGPIAVSPAQAWRALADPDDGLATLVVRETRAPRFLLAATAGGALAVAGALLQTGLRNDLADPGLLGVSGGAGLAVALVTVADAPAGQAALNLAALAGALSAAAVVLVLARLVPDRARLMLAGAALASLFGAALGVVLIVATPAQVQQMHFFLVGSLIGRGWPDLLGVWPWLIAGGLAAATLTRGLSLLRLGDDVADALGARATRLRFGAMAVAVLLTAPIVAHCGPIAFVALVAPHVARRLAPRTDLRLGLIETALFGAVLLGAADLLARQIALPGELPVGLVATALGAPVAVALVRRPPKGSLR